VSQDSPDTDYTVGGHEQFETPVTELPEAPEAEMSFVELVDATFYQVFDRIANLEAALTEVVVIISKFSMQPATMAQELNKLLVDRPADEPSQED